jgi:holo-[acyl-carrier protein] synthase
LPDDRVDDIAIGTDIVEIQRFRELDSDSPFFNRIFTESEQKYCSGYSDPAPHLATTFAGKEAVVKATSSFCTLSMDAIEILRDENGAPFVTLHQVCPLVIRISLSYSPTHAVAVALAFVQSDHDQKHIQGILDDTIQELLPGGEVS